MRWQKECVGESSLAVVIVERALTWVEFVRGEVKVRYILERALAGSTGRARPRQRRLRACFSDEQTDNRQSISALFARGGRRFNIAFCSVGAFAVRRARGL